MEVRGRIIEEATKQFFQYGIRNVTMDDLAVALGISKRTVYETFKDKRELVETCIRKLNAEQDVRVKNIVPKSENVIEAIFVFMQDGIKAMNSINPVFFKDLEKLYPEFCKELEAKNKVEREKLFEKLLSKGITQGLFLSNVDIHIISKLFHEQVGLLADDRVFPSDKYNHADVFRNIVINFVRGISTSKGILIIDKILS